MRRPIHTRHELASLPNWLNGLPLKCISQFGTNSNSWPVWRGLQAVAARTKKSTNNVGEHVQKWIVQIPNRQKPTFLSVPPVLAVWWYFELLHEKFHNVQVSLCGSLMQRSATIVISNRQVSPSDHVTTNNKGGSNIQAVPILSQKITWTDFVLPADGQMKLPTSRIF